MAMRGAGQSLEKDVRAWPRQQGFLRRRRVAGIIRSVSWIRRPHRFRTPGNGPVVFSSAVLFVGFCLSPLCACLCTSTASAHETPTHADHEHADPSDPSKGHGCEHTDCIHLTATLPIQMPSLIAPASHLQSVAETTFESIATLPASPVQPQHANRGPPVPPPVFSILRP